MNKSSSILLSLFLGATLLSLGSCGGGGGSSSRTSLSETQSSPEEEVSDEGIFRAVLKPLNTSLSHNTNGTLEIKVEDDSVSVRSTVTGAPAGVKHLQNIMVGTVCPDDSSDINGDLLVDIKEAMFRSGRLLIPLDSDLSSQLDGIDFGPIANGAGGYVYIRSTGYAQLLSDLKIQDPDPLDPIVKLPEDISGLKLDGRVVLIHGVKSSPALPDTVSGVEAVPRELLMPIACGKLVRVAAEEFPSIETVAE